MNILITMAGDGSRFRKIGFSSPKHMIEVKGRSLFSWSLSSFENFFENDFVFITRAEHKTIPFIEKECAELGIQRFGCLELSAPTAGQAETAMLAQRLIQRPNEPIIIYNIDTYVEPAALRPEMIRGDGWVPVFEAQGERWSFCSFDETGLVNGIAEKRRISNYATIGLYYFKSFELFSDCYHSYDFGGYPERFVAPMYEVLLRDGKRRVYSDVIAQSAVHVLGTPEDVREFYPAFSVPKTP